MHDALSCLVRAFPFLLKISSRKAAPKASVDHHGSGNGGGVLTFKENKRFENALAMFSPDEVDSSASFDGFPERVAPFFPGKSVEQIRSHLEALLHDLDLIRDDEGKRKREDGDVESSGSSLSLSLLSSSSVDRRHIWTREEHERFLRGMNIYGKGDWKRISANVVFRKTPSELASHSQEHFSRRDRPTSLKRRRIIYNVDALAPRISSSLYSARCSRTIKTSLPPCPRVRRLHSRKQMFSCSLWSIDCERSCCDL
ncbi:hypothetical protein ACJRO7_020244 [Eucalyptus globulus]|uniref:Uncharacterized protein n=1 Tax=Eucalyptus globulus TaxID=34317 RepID=A0ABD3KKI7_EUCGL